MAGVIRLQSQEQLVEGVWSADPAPGLQALLRPVFLLSAPAPATATAQMEPVQRPCPPPASIKQLNPN